MYLFLTIVTISILVSLLVYHTFPDLNNRVKNSVEAFNAFLWTMFVCSLFGLLATFVVDRNEYVSEEKVNLLNLVNEENTYAYSKNGFVKLFYKRKSSAVPQDLYVEQRGVSFHELPKDVQIPFIIIKKYTSNTRWSFFDMEKEKWDIYITDSQIKLVYDVVVEKEKTKE
jgi:hypothetical protein